MKRAERWCRLVVGITCAVCWRRCGHRTYWSPHLLLLLILPATLRGSRIAEGKPRHRGTSVARLVSGGVRVRTQVGPREDRVLLRGRLT